MTALSIQPPFPTFTDIDGQPLEDGYIFIGAANLPTQTNPIAVYWDAALSQPATQPIRTIGGYPSNNGTPGRLYVNSDYSILVRNRNGAQVYAAASATERYSDVVLNISSADITFLPAGAGADPRTVQSKLRDTISVLDFGADPTGAVDSAAAFQEAINAIYSPAENIGWGGTLLIPPGTYRIDSVLTIDKHINIEGYGARLNSSGVRCFDLGNVTYLTNLALGYYRVRIAGLYINHAGAGEVIRNQGIRRIVLERVQTIGGLHSLYTEGAYDCPVILNCRFQNSTSHGVNIAQRNNLFTMQSTAVLGSGGYGIHMNTAGAELKGVKLWNVDTEGCAGGIFIGGNTGNVLMDGCWFENNTVFNIRVDNTAGTANKYGISIYNCQITGAGVDVLIGNDAVGGTLIVGVEVSACEFSDSDLVVIGGDKVTEFVEFANRRSGTSTFTIPSAPLAGPLGAAAVRYGTAPTEPFGFAASGVQGDIRYGSGRVWVRNASGWLMLQGAAVDAYTATMQSLPTGATPSVANLRWAGTNNGGATTITDFTNGYVGQELILWGADGGNTTIGHGTNIRLAGGANFTLGTDDTIHLMRTNTKWVEVARSNNV